MFGSISYLASIILLNTSNSVSSVNVFLLWYIYGYEHMYTSYMMHPNDHKSASLDALLNSNISGDTYSAVPTNLVSYSIEFYSRIYRLWMLLKDLTNDSGYLI
jgi:hypothetical protein